MMKKIYTTDVSPHCNMDTTFPHISCDSANGPGAIELANYSSDASYPTGVILNGIPPQNGWIFYTTGTSRNPSTNIINSGGWCLRSIMYPFNNQYTYPCFDNPPSFAEQPSLVICSGYPINYHCLAGDLEIDSLDFQWEFPWQGLYQLVSYSPGYSNTSPLPGTIQNPSNVAVILDPLMGNITFESYTQGTYTTVIKVTSFRCNIKVSEIFREVQVVLLACDSNQPPQLIPPFQNPVTGLYTEFTDTVCACGPYLNIPLIAYDSGFHPDSSPQQIRMVVAGSQFGTNYSSTSSGCLTPPCAILTPIPPIIGNMSIQTTFNWQIAAHYATNAGYGKTTNKYDFWIKLEDDFCPAPAINYYNMSIVVLSRPILESPWLNCVSVDDVGNVLLNWSKINDTICYSFNAFEIFVSENLNGPYKLLAYINNDSILEYTDSLYSKADSIPYYYFVKTRSGNCGTDYGITKDTLQSMHLKVFNGKTGNRHLKWNAPHTPLLSFFTGWYRIFRKTGVTPWSLIDSTQNIFFDDSSFAGNDTLYYKVEMDNIYGCTSVSSIDGNHIKNKDAGISQIINPPSSGIMVKPLVVIKNFGLDVLDTIPVSYKLAGQFSVDEQWTGNLPTGDSATYAFTINCPTPPLPNDICIRTKLKGDQNYFNDKLCKTIQTTGVEKYDFNKISKGYLYPNPASDRITFEYSIPTVGNIQFVITDLLGKEMETYTIVSDPGKQHLELDVKDYKEGMYLIVMKYK
ncbi:T9SS type A sorting domain-containing protein, partial [candidate division KSB1 bacterium]